MAHFEVAELIYSERAEDKMWDHGVTPEQLDEVIDRQAYVVTSNRANRSASHILYGWDAHGRCIAAPIVATDDRSIWRVVTAWHCKPSEITILARKH